jgi:hypothetical protein
LHGYRVAGPPPLGGRFRRRSSSSSRARLARGLGRLLASENVMKPTRARAPHWAPANAHRPPSRSGTTSATSRGTGPDRDSGSRSSRARPRASEAAWVGARETGSEIHPFAHSRMLPAAVATVAAWGAGAAQSRRSCTSSAGGTELVLVRLQRQSCVAPKCHQGPYLRAPTCTSPHLGRVSGADSPKRDTLASRLRPRVLCLRSPAFQRANRSPKHQSSCIHVPSTPRSWALLGV